MDTQNFTTNKRSAAFEAAALGMGFISLATCACIYISIICGALAIIFAILSKGGETTMSQRARFAMWIGVAGLVLTIGLYTFAFISALNEYGSLENLIKTSLEMSGQDIESLFPELAQ